MGSGQFFACKCPRGITRKRMTILVCIFLYKDQGFEMALELQAGLLN